MISFPNPPPVPFQPGAPAIFAAAALYREHLPMRDFLTDLMLHLRFGFMFNAPETFVMGRPIRKDAPLEEIADPTKIFADPDAWFIYMAVGQLRPLARLLPFRLPAICFCRKFNNRLKVYPTDAFLERCGV